MLKIADTLTVFYNADLASIKKVLEQVEAESRQHYYSLSNVTRDGPRNWSLSARPPKAALAALKGSTAAPGPDHIVKRWDAQKKGWRSVDLSTVKRIALTDRHKRKIAYVFV